MSSVLRASWEQALNTPAVQRAPRSHVPRGNVLLPRSAYCHSRMAGTQSVWKRCPHAERGNKRSTHLRSARLLVPTFHVGTSVFHAPRAYCHSRLAGTHSVGQRCTQRVNALAEYLLVPTFHLGTSFFDALRTITRDWLGRRASGNAAPTRSVGTSKPTSGVPRRLTHHPRAALEARSASCAIRLPAPKGHPQVGPEQRPGCA